MPTRTLTMGFFGLVLAAFPGCSPEASPVSVVPSAPGPAPSAGAAGLPEPAALFEGGWAERSLARVPARVSLPDARAWHAHPSGSFTELAHAPTHSTLALRIVNAARLVRPEQCEADARLARPTLPASDGVSVVERRALAAPQGFDTRLVVGVEPRAGGSVRGFALAIGAATGRCFVACFETESAGPHATDLVADRLAVVVSGVFETLRVPSADERVSPPMGVK
jgi:hypothetical protein